MTASAETERELKDALKEWIAKKNGKFAAAEIADDTRLVQEGVLKSLQIMELILWIERRTEEPIDVEQLKPGTFRSVDTIYATFFGTS